LLYSLARKLLPFTRHYFPSPARHYSPSPVIASEAKQSIMPARTNKVATARYAPRNDGTPIT
jgi:hypothetical protein